MMDIVLFASETAMEVLKASGEARQLESEGGREVTPYERANIIANAANKVMARMGAEFRLEVVKKE